MADEDSYFRVLAENAHKNSAPRNSANETGDYFKPINDSSEAVKPKSIEYEPTFGTADDEYSFSEASLEKKSSGKRLISFVILLVVFATLVTYQILISIYESSVFLGSLFGITILCLTTLTLIELTRFVKSNYKLVKVEKLRDLSQAMVNERSYGYAPEFLAQFKSLYKSGPQEPYLLQALSELPDYLNDHEVITRISDDFLSILDEKCKRIVLGESTKVATSVAISQVVWVDSIVVVWRSFSMVRKISEVYGVSLSKLGQLRLYSSILRVAIISGTSQLGLEHVIEKLAPGISGRLFGSIAQGVAMGTYIGKIGIEAMRQSRPIYFSQDNSPDIKLIRDLLAKAVIEKKVKI